MNRIAYLRIEKYSSFIIFAYDKDPNLFYSNVECLCVVDSKMLPRGTIKRLKAGEIIKAELKFSVWKCTILEKGDKNGND